MLAVRLGDKLEEEINTFAKLHKKSKSQIVKEALNLYFEIKAKEDKKSAYELGKEFFGKYSSGDGTLSTTYKTKLKDKLDAKYNADR
jgi:predicted DNA-binding protein